MDVNDYAEVIDDKSPFYKWTGKIVEERRGATSHRPGRCFFVKMAEFNRPLHFEQAQLKTLGSEPDKSGGKGGGGL